VRLAGRADALSRGVMTEVACARALLDELETVLDADHEGHAGCDVVAQVADQLTRLASTMKHWKAERSRQPSLAVPTSSSAPSITR
jgi:hypothetical protein